MIDEQKTNVENILRNCIRNKFQNYTPESGNMPFQTRLLGKDRMALFSFIHSLNTSFGTTIFEPVAAELARGNGFKAATQTKVGDLISSESERVIDEILRPIITGDTRPDKKSELDRIREVATKGEMRKIKPTKIDLMVEKNNEFWLFDIKSPKPNMGEFKGFKRTLLEWAAVLFAQNKNAKVYTGIGILYNPYEPKPYDRWTMAGLLDLPNELKVAEEFWDFLGGDNAYNELLDCFERVGIELKPEIDEYFSKFK